VVCGNKVLGKYLTKKKTKLGKAGKELRDGGVSFFSCNVVKVIKRGMVWLEIS
jgi:hypothetical protein